MSTLSTPMVQVARPRAGDPNLPLGISRKTETVNWHKFLIYPDIHSYNYFGSVGWLVDSSILCLG